MNLVLGIILILFGIVLLFFKKKPKTEIKASGFAFNLQIAGLACILCGVGLLIRGIF